MNTATASNGTAQARCNPVWLFHGDGGTVSYTLRGILEVYMRYGQGYL